MTTVIQLINVNKIYNTGSVETVALDRVSFAITKGEFVAIMGPSGSGKSTLMHIIGALDQPTSGSYTLDGHPIESLSENDLATIRNQKIGFIFQAFNLLPRRTAIQNVMLPLAYAGIPKREREERAQRMLTRVGLEHRLHHTPNQLSGGQQQRVAIARGLVMNPAILLADEPTGNIASTQAAEVMAIFQQLHAEGHTIIMITHERAIAEHAKRIITLRDGVITDDTTKHTQRLISK
jgi:putative ABC transport system ATP-binding protein